MPRQNASKVENNFTKGLVTDVTALQFPPNAATDTDNCIYDFTGRVTRRLGLDLEDDYAVSEFTSGLVDDNEVYTEFLWESVAGQERTFLVIQKGKNIVFYDLTNSTAVGANAIVETLDLNDFLPTGSGFNPANFACQYAAGRGTLVIVNPVCDPFFVEYDATAATLEGTAFDIRARDFAGLDDGLLLTERPTESTASLATNNPEHYYNILNQGWTTTDALSQWDAARTDMPSNADYVAIYRSSVTDSFDNARVLSLSPLTRPAPKGHFILSATNPDRDAAMVADGFSAALGTSSVEIGFGVGSIITAGTVNSGNMFDGITTESAFAGPVFNAGTASYAGKNYSAAPKKIAQMIIHGSADSGFVVGSNPSITWSIYASQTAPASAGDGVVIGSLTFTDTADERVGRTVTSSDVTTAWNYVWARHNNAGTVSVAEIRFFEVTGTSEVISTLKRPSCVAFYSGRLFYAGIEALSLNNTLFFTPILEKTSQYGECYQVNDPTGEFFFDLLPSDGGVIVIPEMGRVIRLINCKNALIVIATNGVWAISGAAGNYFRANDYQVKRVSTQGSTSPFSMVDAQGLPVWWGQDGIYSLKFDPSYDAFSLEFMSTGIIDEFVNAIPTENRKYVKGTYSLQDFLIYWLFYDGELGDDKYIYNRVLVQDVRTKAYYPWTLTAPIGSLNLRGLIFIQAADRTGTPAIKYLASYDVNAEAGTQGLLFAETKDPIHRDWFTFDAEVEDIDGAQEYDSYFITGYYIPGEAIKFTQGGWILTLCEQQDADDSAYVQTAYDFAVNGNSGKWSQRQEIYTDFMEDRSLTWRRLKLRGKGRSLQLRYSSNSTKPFTIIGWSVPLSTEQAV